MGFSVRALAAGDVGKFINCQWQFYRNDPNWVPPLKMDRRKLLDTKKNPFYQHAEIQLFLAEDGNQILGRIAAITNELHNQTHNDNVGFFGFFECVKDQQVAKALVDSASAWLLGKGKTHVRGPVNPSMNDECALLVDGFDTPPRVLMTYNPPYYADLLEGCGFHKVKDLYAYDIDRQDYRSEKLERMQELIRTRYDITIREVDFKNKAQFRRDIDTIKMIYNEAWENNWGFVKLTDEEFDFLAADLKMIANPKLTYFVEMKGKTVGFFLALPDINQQLIHNRGGGILGGAWHLMTKKSKVDTARIIIMGVLPEYRRTGADAVMYYEVGRRVDELGMRYGEASWILEDNVEMRQALQRAMHAELSKTYRIYEKPLTGR